MTIKKFAIRVTWMSVALTTSIIAPNYAQSTSNSTVISKGSKFDAKQYLLEEGTTVVLFLQDSSVIEQQFRVELEKMLPLDKKVQLDLVLLKTLTVPAALQYAVKETPTAIVIDRFGREIGRSSQPDQIKAAVRKGQLMARIKWIDEDDPKAPATYGTTAARLKIGMPGIVKTMALRPDAFKMFNIMSDIHFSDGFLKRREHEMVAAYVSALNKCKF